MAKPRSGCWSFRSSDVGVAEHVRVRRGARDAERKLHCSHMGFAVSSRAYPDIVAAVKDF